MESYLEANRAPLVVGVNSAMIVVSTTAILLRFLSRGLSKAGVWWDDWTILGALPFALILNSCGLYGVRHFGMGKHIITQPDVPRTIDRYLGAQFVFNHSFNFATVLVKISVLLFYTRIFAVSKAFRTRIWILAIWVVCGFLVITIYFVLLCQPVHRFWRLADAGHCGSILPWYILQAIFNFGNDTLILLLPMPIIWRLHISKARRVELVVIFLLGYLVVIMAIVRFITCIRVANSNPDLSWDFVDPLIWSCVEASLAIVFACVPSIAYLFKRASGLLSSSIRSKSGTSHASHGAATVVDTSGRKIGSFTKMEQDNEIDTILHGTGGCEVSLETLRMHDRAKASELSFP